MKRIKQNILSIIAVALFAILSAIVEGSFVCDYGAELGQVAESEKVFTAYAQVGPAGFIADVAKR